MITQEQASKIMDEMSESTKRELIIMAKVKEMHDEEAMDTNDLKMTLALLLETSFPQVMMSKDRIPAAVRNAMPDDVTGLALDAKNDDMMAGFFGGIIAVLDLAGMPAIITDESFLHMLSHSIVAVKSRLIETKIREKVNGNKKQCTNDNAQGAASEA